jgi:methyl-accepting chemotaxis protein
MTPLGLPSLDKISALPTDVLAALRTIPEIVENTRAMKEHTAQLTRVADALDRVAADTSSLPALRDDLVVLNHLPETLERLDKGIEGLDAGIDQLSDLMERILTAVAGLNQSVETLQGAVGPMGRLASRMPGQKKD